MNNINAGCNEEVKRLRSELQQQRGMLWLFGEMIKLAANISSFKELLGTISDMLMGVMGVTNCYLWIKANNDEVEDYTIYYRSIERNNEFKEQTHSIVPAIIRNLTQSVAFEKEDIQYALIHGISIPKSRLAVPLYDVSNSNKFGILVVEHEQEHFFTANTVTFFETLSIYIASKAKNSKMMQDIAEQSIKDPLTGAYNRRYLSTAIDKMRSKYNCVTVAIIDTDNFKKINDELGHLEGDVVLKGIAQIAQGIAKECEGEVIRYGGDEFVILIPKKLSEALSLLEEFRKGVGYLKVAYNLKTNISVTLGVCSYPEMIQDNDEALILAADNALLEGKVKGKNRIVLAELGT